MQENMELNLTRKLWNTIDDMGLQPDTELKILRKIMAYGIPKETEMEQKVLKIVTSSKTEAEILEKISHL